MEFKIEIGSKVKGVGVGSKEEIEGIVLNIYTHIVVIFLTQGSPTVIKKEDIREVV